MGVAEGDTEGEWKDGDSSWDFRSGDGADVNVFDGVDTKFEKSGNPGGRGSDEWLTADGYKPWSFDEEENVPNVLDIGEVERVKEIDDVIKVADEERKKAEKKALENEEKALTAVLKGKFIVLLLEFDTRPYYPLIPSHFTKKKPSSLAGQASRIGLSAVQRLPGAFQRLGELPFDLTTKAQSGPHLSG